MSSIPQLPDPSTPVFDPDATALGHTIVDLLEDRQALDILMLDLRAVSLLADYFILASADNRRQMRALVDVLLEAAQRRELPKPRIEGTADSGWIVLDFGAIVVHLFDPDTRAFYKLEQLWKQAPAVLRIQ